MEDLRRKLLNEHGPKTMLSAVIITVFEDGDGLEYTISDCDPDFRLRLMNGDHPEDNFDNCDIIPKEVGDYLFDIEYDGGQDFNGESTEYWYECFLRNCQPLNLNKMNIDKYIKWSEIWDEEVCLETSVDNLKDNDVNTKIIGVIQQFKEDNDIELMPEECVINADKLVFFFGESGGQNESDTQGWSRDYTFVVDSDFMIIDAEYSQG